VQLPRCGGALASSRESTASLAAAALAIRRAVAPALLRNAVDPEAWGRAGRVDPGGWQLFLRVERCGRALDRLLARHPHLLPAGSAPCAAIAAAAARESARVLVARSHLRVLAEVSARLAAPIIVLKGGVLANTTQAVELSDVDVLIARTHTKAFEEDLRARGFQAIDESSDHVDRSFRSQHMKIEVHHGLGLPATLSDTAWDLSEPLEGLDPLRRLGPLAELHHIVEHVALRHPNRRLRLRDLLLIAGVAGRCEDDRRSRLFQDDRAGYATSVCRAVLERALGSTRSDRPDEAGALMGYVLELRPPVPQLPRELSEFVEMWSVSLLQTRWERQQMWSGATARTLGPSNRPLIRMVEQRNVAIGRAWRVTARAAYRALTWALARPVASRVRRTVRQAQRSPILADS
jgi:hypothetical protein